MALSSRLSTSAWEAYLETLKVTGAGAETADRESDFPWQVIPRFAVHRFAVALFAGSLMTDLS